MKMQTIGLVVLSLCVVVASRFVAIAGLDMEQYGKILRAFFYSAPRILIFLIQFMGAAFLAIRVLGQKTEPKVAIYSASLALVLVSVARFYLPTFLVSVVGDLLVIWWFRRSTSARHEEP